MNTSNPRPRPAGVTLLVLAFAAGIATGWHGSAPWLWPGIAISAILLAAGAFTRRRVSIVPLLGGVFGLGVCWVIMRTDLAPRDALSASVVAEPGIVQLRVVAHRRPEQTAPPDGSMAAFVERPAGWLMPAAVIATVDRAGVEQAASGTVTIWCSGAPPPLAGGDELLVTGTLRPPPPPLNPGAPDGRRLSRARGSAGLLVIEDVRLVQRVGVSRRWSHRLLRARDDLRSRVHHRLIGETDRSPERAALISAMLLGRREAEFPELSRSFRAVGLAHLLAISGLHLGVLAGMVLFGLRAMLGPRRWHGVLIALLVLAYMALVEVRLPVLRAGVMTIAAGVATASGRRLRLTPLLALSGGLLLLWRPEQIFTAGFQLSYGVVLGLIHIGPRLRRTLFGPPDRLAPTVGHMLLQWLATTLTVAITAWAVATPLTIFHFGMMAPLAVPLAVVALPPAALLLGLGYATIAIPALAPAVDWIAGLLLWIVEMAAAVPGATLFLPPPPAAWVFAWAMWLAVPQRPAVRRAGLLVLLAWCAWPLLPVRADPVLRLDMLAVGDGSCIAARSGAQTIIFDAGSSRRPDIGDRVIVPALHRLGIRRIDAIIVSHANLDHYGAVIELIDAFGAEVVVLEPGWYASAGSPHGAAPRALLSSLRERGVTVRPASAGSRQRFGRSVWQWLHPPRDLPDVEPNERSMVIRISAAGRRVLLCGDVEAAAIGRLLERPATALRADVLEMPHHGSHTDAARRLVEVVQPALMLQSTGPRRLEPDRWSESLLPGTRLVTAADGAITVTIDERGRLRTATWCGGSNTIDP